MKSEKVKILFVDFWEGFVPESSHLYKFFQKICPVEISNNPEILIYSVFGQSHQKYNCTKIFFTGENERPDFVQCDFSLGFDHSKDVRSYRLPLYFFYDDVNKLIKRKINADEVLKSKTKFCCFVISNTNAPLRNQFFLDLNKIKHVDSAGRAFNNIGRYIENKRDFIKDYKFVISFENFSYPGYVTEKIFEPLLENCVPIYWGNEHVSKDFNTKSFINSHEFESFDEVIKHVIEVDNNDEIYKKYLEEPSFTNDELNEFVKEENIINFLSKIVSYQKRFRIHKIFKQNKRFIVSKCRASLGKVKRLLLSKYRLWKKAPNNLH